MEDDNFVPAKCPNCNLVIPIRFKHRHDAVCRGCLTGQSVLIKLRVITLPCSPEEVAVPIDRYITWAEYQEMIGK